MFIQHNLSAATADRNLKGTDRNLRTAVERLSTGYRINAADDDAAGLTISEKMRWQIRGLERASENIQDGISLAQVADGALTEVHSMLDRAKELAVQSANDTNTETDRIAIQREIDQIRSEINRISTDTQFNDLRIFKPTKTPEITGSPADILVYHEDYNGGVREGGIIYSGKRYAYEDMANLAYDANGNIKSGTYPVSVYAEDGITPIDIKLIFDGGDRVPSGREYELDPRNDGIYIDLVRHDWSQVKDASGTSLDPANIIPGKYSFQHAGLTIAFDVEEGMDLNSLTESLKKDGLTTYMLRSTDVTTQTPYVTPGLEITPYKLSVEQSKQNLIPANKNSNQNPYPGAYRMHADDTEIYMYLPADNSPDGQMHKFTSITWADLGLTEWMRYQPGANPEWVNPNNNVSQGERPSGYQYHDPITGITLPFTIDSEVSKGEVINAINDWKIEINTDNRMIFESSGAGNAAITPGSHSPELDSYGTQYDMGRDMSGQMTLATNTPITYTGGSLSYAMADAGGKTYTFTSSGVDSTLRSQVQSDLRSYINSYRTAYERRLNHLGSTSVSSTADGQISFTATPGGYTMDLNYNMRLPECLTDASFDPPVQNPLTGRWSVPGPSTASLLNTLTANGTLDSVVNDIVDSFQNTTMSVHTDPGPVHTQNKIKRDLTTTNKRYSSLVIPGDREVKIQSGCRKNQYIAIKLPPMNTALLKLGAIDLTSHPSASTAIGRIDYAIDYISNMRTGYGATQNRLESARSVNDSSAENTQAAESLIRDANMAKESMAFSKERILSSAGQSVLAQANHLPDAVLRMLS